MSDFTRLTVIGVSRKATLVVASDETLAVLLPDIAVLLEEREGASGQPLALVSNLGVELDSEKSPAQLDLADGSVLHLIRTTALPAPPEVSDVTDAVGRRLDASTARWSPRHRRALAAVAVAAGMLSLGLVAGSAYVWMPASVYVAALLIATVSAAFRWTYPTIIATAAGIGMALPTAAALNLPALVIPIAYGLGWLVVSVAAGTFGRSAPIALGGLLGVVLPGIHVVLQLTVTNPTQAAGIVAVLAVAVLGAAPSIALALSRVTALDDQVIAGALPARTIVDDAIEAAYASLSWGVAAVAGALAIAAYSLLIEASLWSTALGAAALLIAVLRTRLMPHAVEAWALWGAALIAALAGVIGMPLTPWAAVVLIATIVTVAILLGGATVSPQARVRWRRWGDSLETVAAVALVPALLGLFGLYELLLGTFS